MRKNDCGSKSRLYCCHPPRILPVIPVHLAISL
jgi:hypothetical protein